LESQLKENDKIKFLNVVGNSMYPTIQENDVLIVSNQKKINIGDIISFKSDTSLIVTHRIIELSANSIVTKGDNRWRKDKSIDTSQVIGVIKEGVRIDNHGTRSIISYRDRKWSSVFNRIGFKYLKKLKIIS